MSTKKISFSDRIFVAGSSGMAGSAICRALKKAGYGLKKNQGELLTPKRNELDLLDCKQVEEWFIQKKPSVVVIAAAKVGGIIANSSQPADFLLENIKIQTNIIESSWKNNVKRLLFLGSSCIYPKFSDQPIREESLLTGPLESTNESYALAKISGIKLCSSLRKQYGFDAISIMPTNLYGPGDNYHPSNSHVLPSLIRRFYEATLNNKKHVICWGTGSPEREFLHSDDLGQASLFSLENWDPEDSLSPKDDFGDPLGFLNVGTGEDLSIKELAEMIASYFEYNGEIIWDSTKPNGTPKKLMDVSRMKGLGWEAKIPINEGIRRTINDFPYEYKNKIARLS